MVKNTSAPSKESSTIKFKEKLYTIHLNNQDS